MRSGRSILFGRRRGDRCLNMKKTIISSAIVIFAAAAGCFAQGAAKAKPAPPPQSKPAAATSGIAEEISSSPAFAEVLLRTTELQAEVESLLAEYTDDYPRVKQVRYELDALKRETARITAVKPAEAGKLTLSLGKLVVRKSELEGDLNRLLEQYKEGHPDVIRAKKKVDVFEAAIKQILG